MAKPELGTKRICPTTGRKFYDLNRDPIVSPYTGEVLARSTFEPAPRSAPSRAQAAEPAVEDEADAAAAGAEVISLEDVAESEESSAGAEEEAGIEEEEAAGEDTFLEEEEGGDDVADLIDGDIEEEEES